MDNCYLCREVLTKGTTILAQLIINERLVSTRICRACLKRYTSTSTKEDVE